MLNTPDLFTKDDLTPHPESAWALTDQATRAPYRTGRTMRLDTDGTWTIEHHDPNGNYTWRRLDKLASTSIRTAAKTAIKTVTEPGTYELVGPKVDRNPHKLTTPTLFRHGAPLTGDELTDFATPDPFPANYFALAAWLREHDYAGIVWFGLGQYDGRTAKLLTKDIN